MDNYQNLRPQLIQQAVTKDAEQRAFELDRYMRVQNL